MLRSRRQAGKYHTNCYYGCCRAGTKAQEKRVIKRKESQEWKKENNV